MAGPERFRGKVLIDTTNPLDFSGGMPPKLAVSGNDSGGERVQRLLPDAFVVKAFNTVGNAFMFRPEFPGGPPDMFICGNHDDAKAKVAGILEDFGWVSWTWAASSARVTSNRCAWCGCSPRCAREIGTRHSSC
jgi:predicted dinucleotide-binding enzyme